MQLVAGQVAVVTGGASGIGLGLARAFAGRGMKIVLADVQRDALDTAVAELEGLGAEVLAVITDVSKEADVQALAAATVERFGAVHVVCNNAGVAATGDPWMGPLASWEWVMGVNFWGVVHGVRAFLPHLVGGGHIVNTSSMAGLIAGLAPSYDASKHAVMAMSVNLYQAMVTGGLPVGVSCLCPGWVRTGIMHAERNWPAELGPKPEVDAVTDFAMSFSRRAIDEGMPPAQVADRVLEAVEADRFWVIPNEDWLDIAVERWHAIADRQNPTALDLPGMPPREQIIAEVMKMLAPPA